MVKFNAYRGCLLLLRIGDRIESLGNKFLEVGEVVWGGGFCSFFGLRIVV